MGLVKGLWRDNEKDELGCIDVGDGSWIEVGRWKIDRSGWIEKDRNGDRGGGVEVGDRDR